VLTETLAGRGDIGDERGVVQTVAGDLAQCVRTRLGPQISDVAETEIYDGLTPVTMTL
jgi:hypothetical protein